MTLYWHWDNSLKTHRISTASRYKTNPYSRPRNCNIPGQHKIRKKVPFKIATTSNVTKSFLSLLLLFKQLVFKKIILHRFSYYYLSSRSTPESLAVRCRTPLKTWGERDHEICWGLFDRNGVSTISLYFIREASYRRGASIRVDGMPKGPHQPNVIWMSLLCLTLIRKAIKLLVITQPMIIFSRVQVPVKKALLERLTSCSLTSEETFMRGTFR